LGNNNAGKETQLVEVFFIIFLEGKEKKWNSGGSASAGVSCYNAWRWPPVGWRSGRGGRKVAAEQGGPAALGKCLAGPDGEGRRHRIGERGFDTSVCFFFRAILEFFFLNGTRHSRIDF